MIRGGSSLDSHVVAFHDTLFALATISTGLVVGRLRTAETASRLQARDLSRHTMREEAEVRRRVAQSIHDGPVQDLIGLDMILSTLGRELEGDGKTRARELLTDARELTTRNVQALRDEMVDLGPYGFQDVTLAAAIEELGSGLDAGATRWTSSVELDPELLPPKVAGELFRISQEAVINAGRHAGASTVRVTLRRDDHAVELQRGRRRQGLRADRRRSRGTSASRACASGRSCSTGSSTSGRRRSRHRRDRPRSPPRRG